MKRTRAFFVGGLTAITLIAGTAVAIATTADGEEPPPDAPPSWVLSDGTIDPSAIPQEAPEVLSDGRPNDNAVLGPQIPSEPLSTSGTNPPDVVSSDPDPADDDEEGTELLEWETPESTCGWATQTPAGGKLVVDVCSRTSQRAVNGNLQDTVATDGKCITAAISIGTYSRSWKACDGTTVKLDTGYRDGTAVSYRFSVA
ncbi:hypothetical protein OIB37_12645 [Streptomyces sp. NBC_00820]|uniref:hypothetical protein n=1 Tax=Streptomyces sp. NBC_00820 TaxID=2975842 RepID=UPI002ED213BA|nr:hypothetical protein OIB37_12645 [Streptomyces sp. NBC_00820]